MSGNFTTLIPNHLYSTLPISAVALYLSILTSKIFCFAIVIFADFTYPEISANS
jgi:hypothetical protein